MLTIVTTPPKCNFAENPVRYDLSTTNWLYSVGTKASIELTVSGTDSTEGHTFVLTVLKDNELTFTLDNTPDDSGLQISTCPGGGTFSSWAALIYDGLRENYLILTNYDVELDDAGPSSRVIRLRAKAVGDDYNLDFDAGTVTGIAGTPVSGVANVERENFVVVCTIWDDEYTKLFEDQKPVDTTGGVTVAATVRFDIAEYLEAYIKNVLGRILTWPESSVYMAQATAVQKFLVSFAEKYSGVVKGLTFDTEIYAMLGGISRDKLVLYNANSLSYWGGSKNIMRFMTWAPLQKRTSTTASEKLYYFFQGDNLDYNSFILFCEVTFTDDSTQTIESSGAVPVAFDQYSIVEYMVGYVVLGLGSLAKTVKSWKVWLANENETAITEEREYVLDKQTYLNERLFIFQNSFGVFDTIRCTGILDSTAQYDRVSGITLMDEDETAFNAPDRNFIVKEKEYFTANTGWLSRESKDWLRDLLLSTEVYEVIDGELVPVRIITDKSQLFTDKETLYSLEFEYVRGWDNKNISLDYDPGSGSE